MTQPRPRRGYALIIVLSISMVLAIGIGTMLSYLASAEKTSARQRLNREAYYVCDGLGRVVTKATVDILADESRFSAGATSEVLANQLRGAVLGRLGTDLAGVRPAGYVLDGPSADAFAYRNVDATASFGSVAVGRFAGMSGQRRTFTYDLAMRKTNGSACKTTATVDSMRIPFGEFALFADEDTRLCPSWSASDITRTARYHINGDFEVGNVALPRTTMTGQLSTRCNNQGNNARLRFCVADRCIESGTSSSALENTNFLSTTVFSDGRRGTSELSLAITPQRAQHGTRLTTSGASTDADESTTNAANFRFLVDPGFRTDNAGVKSMKLAHLALIRILDGVWYVNDGSTWPGRPIWSDHRGSYEITPTGSPEERAITGRNIEVGRGDLYSSSTPTHYSTVDDSVPDSVVSYGFLKRLTNDMPQFWRSEQGSGTPAERSENAARTGFVDVHEIRDADDRTTGRTGNVLPINFDLGQFVKQLSNTSTNELGEQLARDDYDHNNVIVWIGSTWPGSLKGLNGSVTDTRPTPSPVLAADSGAVTTSHLPYPMCDGGETDDTKPRHCGSATRVNAVRVFNGGVEMPGSLRVTIASSLPMYVMGSIDRETESTTDADVVLPNSFFGAGFDDNYALGNGPDVFFAADSVTLLSDDWEDAQRPWVEADGSSAEVDIKKIKQRGLLSNVPAYNASFLIGRPLIGSGYKHPYGFERSLRFLEKFAGITKGPIVTGSILVGFRSVYTVAPVCYGPRNSDGNCDDDQPWRHFWSSELASGGGQPPGMPAFSLRAQGETIPDSMQIDLSSIFGFIFGFN